VKHLPKGSEGIVALQGLHSIWRMPTGWQDICWQCGHYRLDLPIL